MKKEEILKSNNLGFLLTVFFNWKVEQKKNEENKFEVCFYSTKAQSKKPGITYVDLSEKMLERTVEQNKKFFSIRSSRITNKGKTVEIEIDDVSPDESRDFVENIFNRIMKIKRESKIDGNKMIRLAAAYWASSRCSIDFKAQYVTVDLIGWQQSSWYFNLVSSFMPLMAFKNYNLNIRTIQSKAANKKSVKNWQMRFKLDWFWKECGKYLKSINFYKYEIIAENERNIRQSFSKNRINDNYKKSSDNLYFILKFNAHPDNAGKHVIWDDELRNKWKRETSLVAREHFSSGKKARKASVKDIASDSLPDYCFGCHNKYDRKDRTFKTRNGKWYFELHHVISFANGNKKKDEANKDVDVPMNITKLCPVCHDALSSRRGTDEVEKKIIRNILTDAESNLTLRFVSEYLEIDRGDIESLVEGVMKLLK